MEFIIKEKRNLQNKEDFCTSVVFATISLMRNSVRSFLVAIRVLGMKMNLTSHNNVDIGQLDMDYGCVDCPLSGQTGQPRPHLRPRQRVTPHGP